MNRDDMFGRDPLAGLDTYLTRESTEPCAHEDVTLECPMCGAEVDEDMRVCPTCHEMVDPVRYCPDCEEELGTLGDFEDAERERKQAEAAAHAKAIEDHPRHRHTWVETGQRHTDTGDWVKRCVECGHEV